MGWKTENVNNMSKLRLLLWRVKNCYKNFPKNIDTMSFINLRFYVKYGIIISDETFLTPIHRSIIIIIMCYCTRRNIMNITVEELNGKLDSMTKEELRTVSLQKKKNGCATSAALIAQFILWEENGCCFSGSYNWKRNHTPVRKI